MHIHIMMSIVRFNWALRQSTQTAIQHASMPKKSTFRLSSEPPPVLSCKQQTIALSIARNVINNYILRHSINVLSLVATAHPQPQNFLSLSQIQWRHEPTIEHKYSLLELQVSTWPEPLLATESMQDHKQHIYDRSIINLTQYSIFIGSQQTQHVALQIDDLDHDRQLTRSKHDSTRGEDNHLATAMDPQSKDELLTHQSGGGHDDVEPLR